MVLLHRNPTRICLSQSMVQQEKTLQNNNCCQSRIFFYVRASIILFTRSFCFICLTWTIWISLRFPLLANYAKFRQFSPYFRGCL